MTTPDYSRTDRKDDVSWLAYYEQTLDRPRYREAGRLLAHGAKIYSQNDEDGILQEIYRRIGIKNHRFIEFGVQNGQECNSVLLLMTGWSGLWCESDEAAAASIRDLFEPFISAERLRCENVTIAPDNINEVLGAEGDVDLLSIDTDYHDYWLWKALDAIRPRVVVVEYNATLKPPLSLTVPYEADESWDGTSFFGASLTALEKLGNEKGYALVGCCFSGVNAFFVRKDLVGDHFCAPYTAENHYEPARYGMCYPVGHPPRLGLYENV